MQRLFDPWFWLSIRPTPLSEQTTYVLLILSIVVLGVTIAHGVIMRQGRKTQEKPERKLHEKIQNILLIITIFAFLWTFLAYEGVQIFSARFWVLGAVGLVAYLSVNAWQYAQGPMKHELNRIVQQKGNKVYSASNKNS